MVRSKHSSHAISRHVGPASFLSRPVQRRSSKFILHFHCLLKCPFRSCLRLLFKVKSWGNLSRRNLRDLLDCIRRRKSNTANQPTHWKALVLIAVFSLALPHYSPFIWQLGSSLLVAAIKLAGRDSYEVSYALLLMEKLLLAGSMNPRGK